jgi:hypothetical protein
LLAYPLFLASSCSAAYAYPANTVDHQREKKEGDVHGRRLTLGAKNL